MRGNGRSRWMKESVSRLLDEVEGQSGVHPDGHTSWFFN